mgnify:CR=1 FL=1
MKNEIRFEIAHRPTGSPVPTCWVCRERLASIGCLVCGYTYCQQCLAMLVNNGTNGPRACAGCGEDGEILAGGEASYEPATP